MYENEFRVGMGAEAIKELLAAINVDELSESLKEELKNTTSQKKARIIKRLEVIEACLLYTSALFSARFRAIPRRSCAR